MSNANRGIWDGNNNNVTKAWDGSSSSNNNNSNNNNNNNNASKKKPAHPKHPSTKPSQKTQEIDLMQYVRVRNGRKGLQPTAHQAKRLAPAKAGTTSRPNNKSVAAARAPATTSAFSIGKRAVPNPNMLDSSTVVQVRHGKTRALELGKKKKPSRLKRTLEAERRFKRYLLRPEDHPIPLQAHPSLLSFLGKVQQDKALVENSEKVETGDNVEITGGTTPGFCVGNMLDDTHTGISYSADAIAGGNVGSSTAGNLNTGYVHTSNTGHVNTGNVGHIYTNTPFQNEGGVSMPGPLGSPINEITNIPIILKSEQQGLLNGSGQTILNKVTRETTAESNFVSYDITQSHPAMWGNLSETKDYLSKIVSSVGNMKQTVSRPHPHSVEPHEFDTITEEPESVVKMMQEKEPAQAKEPVVKTGLGNTYSVRTYVTQALSAELDYMVAKMLSQLFSFQERTRQKEPQKAKSKRRLVFGLREVLRGIKTRKVKCVIVATDIEQGWHQDGTGLDTRVTDIIDLANRGSMMSSIDGVVPETTPLVFALNRRKLGKALGLKVRASIVGIYNADGAYDIFKLVLQKAEKLSLHWAQEIRNEIRMSKLPKCGNEIASIVNGSRGHSHTVGGACGSEVRSTRYDCVTCGLVYCETCAREIERLQKQQRDKQAAALVKATKAGVVSAVASRYDCEREQHTFIRVSRILDQNIFPAPVVSLPEATVV